MKKNTFYTKYFNKGRSDHLTLKSQPDSRLQMIVVIPSFDEDLLIESLDSLCKDVEKTERFEVIVIENFGISSDVDIRSKAQNNSSLVEKWLDKNPNWKGKMVHKICELPDKSAGVGLARKIGMDTAAFRFVSLDKSEGIILNYDADCNCKPGYLEEVLYQFNQNHQWDAASIYFEHPINKIDQTGHRKAIVDYELHLRAYIEWQRHLNLPYAFHTVGSAMAARAAVYTRKGGMNKRKAGEDFYFIHKFTQENFGEINSTEIYPSCRESSRVPFGTGRAIQESLRDENDILTYSPMSYLALAVFLEQLPMYYDHGFNEKEMDSTLVEFFKSQGVEKKMDEITNNTTHYASYCKRFFQWFDAFLLMKYLHFMRDSKFENISCLGSTNFLLEQWGRQKVDTNEEALLELRRHQKEFNGAQHG